MIFRKREVLTNIYCNKMGKNLSVFAHTSHLPKDNFILCTKC